jgi:hypothetical protein
MPGVRNGVGQRRRRTTDEGLGAGFFLNLSFILGAITGRMMLGWLLNLGFGGTTGASGAPGGVGREFTIAGVRPDFSISGNAPDFDLPQNVPHFTIPAED